MIFSALPLAGAYLIEPEPATDERGSFSRLWCAKEFAARGLRADFVQSSVSSNRRRGTLRGLHYQLPPHAEAKLVRCIRGAAFDVMVDLRPHSPTYLDWHACELTASGGRAVYIPEGLAHGFQTLKDDTELLYEITACYSPAHIAGVRWNDDRLGIRWPHPQQAIVSQRDCQLPLLADQENELCANQ